MKIYRFLCFLKLSERANYSHQNKYIFEILQTVIHKCGVVQRCISTHLSNRGIPGDLENWLIVIALPLGDYVLSLLSCYMELAVTRSLGNVQDPFRHSSFKDPIIQFFTPPPVSVCNDHCHP